MVSGNPLGAKDTVKNCSLSIKPCFIKNHLHLFWVAHLGLLLGRQLSSRTEQYHTRIHRTEKVITIITVWQSKQSTKYKQKVFASRFSEKNINNIENNNTLTLTIH